MTARLALALAVARRLAAAPFSPTPAAKLPSASPTRCFAIGDPQATAAQFFGALETAGILGDDGFLAPDALLVSIGDHFDFKFPDPDEAGLEGLAILSWMAAHSPAQVRILFGNHDLARVQEMGALDDATFRRARALGRQAKSKDAAEAGAAREAFEVEFPDFPSPEVAGRDYSSYSTAQRGLVQALLLEGRAGLATTARLGDGEALLTHAGVSLRDLQVLGIPGERAARPIAEAIEQTGTMLEAQRYIAILANMRLRDIPGISGATELGDRRAVLVLDVGALMEDLPRPQSAVI